MDRSHAPGIDREIAASLFVGPVVARVLVTEEGATVPDLVALTGDRRSALTRW